MAIQKLGRYEIVSELGKGAMGTVYKAVDPLIERTVAIKTINLDLPADEIAGFRDRFAREAKSAGRLNHPNVVTIYDVGETESLAYIAMEYLEGQSLRDMLDASGRLSIGTICDIAAQIADGLAYAQQFHIVHRDIKPANIMVSPGGRAKITDFGIAYMPSSSKTQTGTVLGSPKYMSPEQVTGMPLDGRSDVFSLGVVLYEMLTGQVPFEGMGDTTIFALMHRIVHEMPPKPSSLVARVPSAFDLIAAKAMAKLPENRYQSAAEMAADLRNSKGRHDTPALADVGDATLVVPRMTSAAPAKGANLDATIVYNRGSAPATASDGLLHRVRAEAEAKARAEMEAKARVEAEAKARAEMAVKLRAEQEAKAKAALTAKFAADLEAFSKAETEARMRAEAARLKAEMEARIKAEARIKEERARAAEAARLAQAEGQARKGWLGQIKEQAAAKEQQVKTQQSDQEQAIKLVEAKLRLTFAYLSDMVKQLNVLKPQVPRQYDLLGVATLGNLTLSEGFVDFRTRKTRDKDFIDHINLSFQLSSHETLKVQRDAQTMARFDSDLRSFNLVFHCREFKNDRHVLQRGEYSIQSLVRINLTVRGDPARGLIGFLTKNLERLGASEYVFEAGVIDDDLLDEFAKLLTGHPSRFRALATRQNWRTP